MSTKYAILRVKRKRDDEALESVLVEYESKTPKKNKPNLAAVLDGLDLGSKKSDGAEAATSSKSVEPAKRNDEKTPPNSSVDGPKAQTKAETEAVPAAMKMFTRVSTIKWGEVSKAESCKLVLDQIESMKTMKQIARRVANKTTMEIKADKAELSRKMNEKASAARTDVVRRRRLDKVEGLDEGGKTEKKPDAFAENFSVNDFVVSRRENGETSGNSGEQRTMMCNGQVMTRETVDDDYVYDIYVMADLAGDEEALRDPEAVVRMETFDESLLLVDDEDGCGKEYDFGEDEDSNDENYHGNDYPEDEDSSEGEDEHDHDGARYGGFGTGYNRRPTLSSEDEDFYSGHDKNIASKFAYEPEMDDDDYHPSYMM